MPWERNRNPKMMRAKSSTIDFVDDEVGSLNSDFSNFFRDIICDVFCETPHIVILFDMVLCFYLSSKRTLTVKR